MVVCHSTFRHFGGHRYGNPANTGRRRYDSNTTDTL
jgi:hypothetical protein